MTEPPSLHGKTAGEAEYVRLEERLHGDIFLLDLQPDGTLSMSATALNHPIIKLCAYCVNGYAVHPVTELKPGRVQGAVQPFYKTCPENLPGIFGNSAETFSRIEIAHTQSLIFDPEPVTLFGS
jgi:hypothetical protein